jgi:hypothetical protein
MGRMCYESLVKLYNDSFLYRTGLCNIAKVMMMATTVKMMTVEMK